MNRSSNAEDHMFYKCSVLLRQLASIPGMDPYMKRAVHASEKCAEQQALALLQQLQQLETGADAFRASVGSGGFSIYLDQSGGLASTTVPIANSIFTFTAGVLPANLTLDPATQLWKLFQQGVPLCLLFNTIEPEHAIPLGDSDDLRMCKKAVYDFLIAVKMHLELDDEFMFTISNVFSDNTHDLLKIVKVVSKLVEMKNGPDLTKLVDAVAAQIADLKITDEKSKVFRELIQTERKYILDLELLMEYKQELQAADALSSEQLHVLFPNLADIVDFHRRLLTGLECNIDVPCKYQRIGSVFIHASNGPFRAYEPWTIGQVSAIDLISREAANLRRSSTLLDPGFELQSYIIKPIQRLCKYPLLLKELIKTYDALDSVGYNELLMASSAMKDVANQVNEAQRRSENIGFLQNLVERVKHWRGFNLRDQGDLLYHSVVGVKDGDADKEYVAYLFENIIFFFVEVNNSGDPKHKEKKKRDILTSRKKSNSSLSTANLLESLNGARERSMLELRGRVYISEIYNISSSNYLGHTLVISWSGKKESGSFTLRFKTEEPRNQWENCLRHLKTNEMNSQIHRRAHDLRGSMGTYESYDVTALYANGSPVSQPLQGSTDSPGQRSSVGSSQRHNSSSSAFSLLKFGKYRSDSHSNSNSNSNVAPVSSSPQNNSDTTASSSSGLISPLQIRLIYNKLEIGDTLNVSASILFSELQLKISLYIAASDEIHDDVVISKLKYKDEDGDLVVMDSADDWILAVDMANELCEHADDKNLTIWVS